MELDNRFRQEYLEPGNVYGNCYNVLFYNTPREIFPAIRKKLGNTTREYNGVKSLLIEFNKKDFDTIDKATARLKTCMHIESTYEQDLPEYFVCSTYVIFKVAKTLLENNCIKLGPNESAENYLAIINEGLNLFSADDRAGSPVLNTCLQSSAALETLFTFGKFEKEELNIVLDGKVPPIFQQQLNTLIARRDMHIKLWTTEQYLSTYQVHSGLSIQHVHDYLSYDVEKYIKSYEPTESQPE